MALMGDFYRYLHSWFGNKPSRFGWVIKDKLAASGRLMKTSQLAWAVKNGIKNVVTIRESPLNPAWFPKEAGIDYKHLKVEDFGAPPVNELGDLVDYIDNEINNDKPVIVHCNGGSGRTGTVLAAYLMKKESLTAVEAVKKVKEIRGRTIRHQKQLDTLKEYESYLQTKNR
jgi:atypical dual specificity phosphatase